MAERIAEASPRPRATITGVVYLLYFLTAIFSMLFLKGLVVYGDAASTANNILAHQSLFRLGISTGLIATACYVAVTALFYDLFKPVNKTLLYSRRSSASWDVPFLLSLASFNSPRLSCWEAGST